MLRSVKYAWLILPGILFALLAGCGGGDSPVSPGTQDAMGNSPREVLNAFADACIAQDVDTACGLLLNPARWRRTLELSRDVLPLYGRSIRKAEETRRERDCYRYRVRISHPSDPRNRVIESRIYVARIRGFDGRTGRWGVDFTYPGDGQAEIRRKRALMSESALPAADRRAQWGTMNTHASVLTRAILLYYYLMYPEDVEFTGKYGLLNPYNNHYGIDVDHPGPVETILFFDYDTYESMPPDAVMVKNVANSLVQAGSADEDVFVGEFNPDGTVNFLRDIAIAYDGGIVFKSTNDFGNDDDTFFKGFAHFLTPVTQSEWETEYSEFNDMGALGGTGGAAVRSLDWALGNGVLGPYDILGVVDLRASRNRKTLPQAVDLMDQARHTPNQLACGNLLGNSFYTFGFTLHLLEDTSCPAHSRNDMHGVPIISSIPGLGGLQPDPLEDWGDTITPTFVHETVGLFNDLAQQHDPIVRDETGFPGNPMLQNLYVNASNPDFAGVEALFEYTALMSNRMCFSEDTIYVSTNYDAANTDYYPYLTDLDLDFFGKTVLWGSGGPPVTDDEYIVAVGNGMFDVWRSWFWSTHWFTDPDVEDVEDALRNGWDILTVADDDDEDYYSNSVLGVREQQWRLLFPVAVKTGAAYVHEFYLATRE